MAEPKKGFFSRLKNGVKNAVSKLKTGGANTAKAGGRTLKQGNHVSGGG